MGSIFQENDKGHSYLNSWLRWLEGRKYVTMHAQGDRSMLLTPSMDLMAHTRLFLKTSAGQCLQEPHLDAEDHRKLHRSRCDENETLQSGDQVALVGFGTFSVRTRAARTGRNPKTGEEIQIAEAKVPAFKAGKALKDSCN